MTNKTEDAPGETGQPNGGKPFVLGTLNAEQLQEYVTDWIAGALDWGADSADALKHHCEMLVSQGPDAGIGATHLSCVQSCMIQTTLSGDSTDKLFGPMATSSIFPNVDWRRACDDALKRKPARMAAYQAEQEERDKARDDQTRAETEAAETEAAETEAEVEAQAREESTDPAVSETPTSRGDATLYALRSADGSWMTNEVYENDGLHLNQVEAFPTADEAAACRYYTEGTDAGVEIVPMLSADAQPVQLAQENQRLKQELAKATSLSEKLIDQYPDDAVFDPQLEPTQPPHGSARPRQYRLVALQIWIAIPIAIVLGLALTAIVSWSSAKHYYGVAEQSERERAIAQEYKDTQREHDAAQAKRIVELTAERKYQDALLVVDALSSGRQEPLFSETRVDVLKAIIAEVYGGQDMADIDRALRNLETTKE